MSIYSNTSDYYVYKYLRKDGTPYYIGKGRGRRYLGKHSVAVPPIERIEFIETNMTEADAFALESKLILEYGRKDLGTGPLRNLTSGGEGSSPGPELRKRLSEANKGKVPWNKGISYTTGPSELKSISKTGSNHPQYGKSRTPEERERISKGIAESWDRPAQICPHCGFTGRGGSMSRWHMDNCRHKE